MKLALAIIAKNEVEQCQSIITKYGQYFDEIAIAVDERLDDFQVLATDKVVIHPYQWCNDFSHKRNFLAERIKSEYYLRMDTDDDLGNAEILPQLFARIVEKDIDVHYAPYDYAKDEHGNVIARHWRETIIKKRPDVYWKKAIHENMFFENQNACRLSKDKSLVIIHNIDASHAIDSFKRNFAALIEEYKQDGENTDPRTVAYLGRMMMAESQWERAIFFLEKLILRSGWDDDKYFAYIQMAQCYQSLGKLDSAIACCNEALAINTQFPDAYLQLGYIYLSKGDYTKAVDWIMPGVVRPEPDTCMVYDPTMYNAKAKMAAAMALLGKGDAEQALSWFNKAKQANPSNPDVLKYEPTFQSAYESLEYLRKITWLALFTKEREPQKVQHLLDSIPACLDHDERLWSLRHKMGSTKTYPDNHIAIYCGQSWEEWSDVSVLRGIGGSEEAVIYLSRELVKLGYDVTVFNSCGEMEGEYNGVKYVSYLKFNPRDRYNVLISWRHNIFKEGQGMATKQIVWLHDVPNNKSLDCYEIHKLIVLSKYHQSLLDDAIPKGRILLSSNGINNEDFATDGIIRNPKRMIYTSSYDRGLVWLLLMWPTIIKRVPDAELHIFYGWDTWIKMETSGFRKPEDRQVLQQLIKQQGIFDHGRVSHRQLIKEFKKSGLFVYPSHFEEISCISAMKAQECGCVPVTTDFAALSETVKTGIKIPGDIKEESVQKTYCDALLDVLENVDKQEELRKDVLKLKGTFGWDKVAQQWHKEFLSKEVIIRLAYKDMAEYKRVYHVNKEDVKYSSVDLKGGQILLNPRWDWVIKELKNHDVKKIADLGCCDGGLCFLLEKEGYNCTGVEISKGLHEVNVDNAKAFNSKVNFVNAAVEEYKPDTLFDCVLLLDILEHFLDPKKAMQAVEDCVEEGGLVIVSTPHKDGIYGDTDYHMQHINLFDEESLRQFIGNDRIIRIETKGDIIFAVYRKGVPPPAVCSRMMI